MFRVQDQFNFAEERGAGRCPGTGGMGMFYFFFLSHRELGIQPASAAWLGVLGFALGGRGRPDLLWDESGSLKLHLLPQASAELTKNVIPRGFVTKVHLN
jgi:hypothetical protein